MPEWPQVAVLFALGVRAARAGWLTDLPRQLVRRLAWLGLAGTVAVMALFALVLSPGDDELPRMGAGWPTLLFALLDGLIAVASALWFIDLLQRRWPTHGPLIGKAGRGSFATYFIHPLVLTTIMLLFGPVPLAPEIKFVPVAAAAIPACFTVGYVLTRLPGASKVL